MQANDLLRAELQQLRGRLAQAQQASNRWCSVVGVLMHEAGMDEGFFTYRAMFDAMRDKAPTLTQARAKNDEDGQEHDGLHVTMRDKQAPEEN